MRVQSRRALIGICSHSFDKRKLTRSKFNTDYSTTEKAEKDNTKLEKDLKRKSTRHLEGDENKLADGAIDDLSGWNVIEDAFAVPKIDTAGKTRGAQNWAPGDTFRAAVDGEVYEVTIPQGWKDGPVRFQVTSRYCGLGEDPQSLNVGYSGHANSVGKPNPIYSSAFAVRRPDVAIRRRSQTLEIVSEGRSLPAAISSDTDSAAQGMILSSLRYWQAGDTVGVCVDSDVRTIEYTLNGLSLGKLSLRSHGFSSYEPWFPAASVQGGGCTFVFASEDLCHAPPKPGCKFFPETALTSDEDVHFETIKATVPSALKHNWLSHGKGTMDTMNVKTSDGRVVRVPIPEGAEPGDEVEVQIPIAASLGHFQVVKPVVLRSALAVDSKKCGMLQRGDVIALYEKRTVSKSILGAKSLATVLRGRCDRGWFNMADAAGEEVLIHAERDEEHHKRRLAAEARHARHQEQIPDQQQEPSSGMATEGGGGGGDRRPTQQRCRRWLHDRRSGIPQIPQSGAY